MVAGVEQPGAVGNALHTACDVAPTPGWPSQGVVVVADRHPAVVGIVASVVALPADVVRIADDTVHAVVAPARNAFAFPVVAAPSYRRREASRILDQHLAPTAAAKVQDDSARLAFVARPIAFVAQPIVAAVFATLPVVAFATLPAVCGVLPNREESSPQQVAAVDAQPSAFAFLACVADALFPSPGGVVASFAVVLATAFVAQPDVPAIAFAVLPGVPAIVFVVLLVMAYPLVEYLLLPVAQSGMARQVAPFHWLPAHGYSHQPSRRLSVKTSLILSVALSCSYACPHHRVPVNVLKVFQFDTTALFLSRCFFLCFAFAGLRSFLACTFLARSLFMTGRRFFLANGFLLWLVAL
jgi:hypothetical protein